jgi:hypothetical protein
VIRFNLDPVERYLEFWCSWHWGPGRWPSPCRHPIRWRVCAWLLDTCRDVRAWIGGWS